MAGMIPLVILIILSRQYHYRMNNQRQYHHHQQPRQGKRGWRCCRQTRYQKDIEEFRGDTRGH